MLGSLISTVAALSLGSLAQPLQYDEPVPPMELPAVDAPAGTDAAVNEYLEALTSGFYDPRADGLVSVAFTLPVTDAMMGHTANTFVSWTAGSAPTVTSEVLDFELPPMLAQAGVTLDQVRQAMGPQAEASGREVLDRMLGNVIGDLGRGRVATMAGVEDGYVVVSFGPSALPMDPITQHLLYIDDDGVLAKHIVVAAGGPMGEQRVENQLQWESVKDGELVVAKNMAMVMDTPMGRLEVQKQSFGYQQVGSMVLLTSVSTAMNELLMPGAPVTQTLTDLVVNGQPVAAASEGPMTPAADAAPSEG
ncbi:MAG: hypothetical protein ACI9EF_000661 [Pseudohongiellaceae bacterium]|jgi:hypothetical protein